MPDPTTVGPSLYHIGSEGGMAPSVTVIDNTPIGYDYARRSITVLNILNKSLYLGPAERADVVVDFSSVPPGSTLILYNDSPAPVPAFDPRYDYYTGDPDQSYPTGDGTGGAPTTLAGFGPNTRTIMQIQVTGTAAAPFNLAGLEAAIPPAFAASQPPAIIPETTYPVASGSNAAVDTYSRIGDTSLTFTPVGGTAPITMAMEPKAIQELFELDYGRMNATLGVELPFTNFNTQTTIPLGFRDPVTEIMNDGETQIWKITHNGVDTHFIHFHLVNVQVINRVGWDGSIRPPDNDELGWKDTVRMNPLEDCIVAVKAVMPTLPWVLPDSVRLLDPTMVEGATLTLTNPVDGNVLNVVNAMTNFGAEYVWHCHILGHEENDMMRALVVTVPTAVPGAPVIGSAAAGNAQATVNFGPPAAPAGGSSAITSYVVTSAPGGKTATVGATATSAVVTGLTNGTTYTFTVRAVNSVGTGPASAASNPVTPLPFPAAPTNVTAQAANASAIVSFTLSPNPSPGAPITGYTVTSNPGGKTGTGTTSPITVTGLTNGTSYTFTVTATNAIGTSAPSAASNAITAKALPGAPTNVTAVPGNTLANVSFTPPAAGGGTPITSYTVVVMPGGRNVAGTGSPITVTGLTNGTAYTFYVKATNAAGTGPLSAASNTVTPLTIPGAPVIHTALAGPGSGQVSVNFTAPTSNGGSAIVFYTATVSPGGGTTTGTASPIIFPGLTNGTAYTFTVTATNAAGTGPASAASNSVTPRTVPGAPTIGTATAGNAQATVTFAPPTVTGGSPITSYTVTSNPGGKTATGTASPITVTGLTNGTAYTFTVTATSAAGTGAASAASNSVTPKTIPGAPTIGTATAGNGLATVTFTPPASDGGSPITLYTVTSTPGSYTATGTTSPIAINGLPNGSSFAFTVKATNAAGTGPVSALSNSVVPTNVVPAQPTPLTATVPPTGTAQPTVTLTWISRSNNAAGFTLQRATDTNFTVSLTPFNFAANQTSYVDSPPANVTYYYRVAATNVIGPSAWSPTATALPAQLPGTPTGLTATPTATSTTLSTVTLNWTQGTPGAAPANYTVQVSANGGTTWSTLGTTTTTTYSQPRLTRGRTYQYRVQANGAAGTSAWATVTVAVP